VSRLLSDPALWTITTATGEAVRVEEELPQSVLAQVPAAPGD